MYATNKKITRSTYLVQRFEILPELLSAVILGDFDLKSRVIADEGGESRERLPSAAADADQQHVASRLANPANDSSNVLDRVSEQHQIHRNVADSRVVGCEKFHHVAWKGEG